MSDEAPASPPPPGSAVAADSAAAREASRRLAGNFGFRPVEPAEKAALVRGVFDRVAARYDLMNDLMSGGVHRLWKEALLDWLAPRPGIAHLDVAGGTGDIALRLLDRVDGQAGGHAPRHQPGDAERRPRPGHRPRPAGRDRLDRRRRRAPAVPGP
jgi:hypothetical protein